MLEELRAIYREKWPYRDADHWKPSDGELVICEYFNRLRQQDLKETSRLAKDVFAMKHEDDG